MIMTLSPAIAKLTGPSGPFTATTRRGVCYIRKRISKTDHPTPTQLHQRANFQTLVAWWHELPTQLVNWLKTLTDYTPYMAYNLWLSANLPADMHAQKPPFIPAYSPIQPVVNFWGEPGGPAPGWVAFGQNIGQADPAHKAYILYGLSPDPAVAPVQLRLLTSDYWQLSAMYKNIPVGQPGVYYAFALMAEDTINHRFSPAYWCRTMPRS